MQKQIANVPSTPVCDLMKISLMKVWTLPKSSRTSCLVHMKTVGVDYRITSLVVLLTREGPEIEVGLLNELYTVRIVLGRCLQICNRYLPNGLLQGVTRNFPFANLGLG